jgi:hypothetical protein
VSGRVVKTVKVSPVPSTSKRHVRALAAADPLALHGLDAFGPVEVVQVIEELLGVVRDAEHPLAHEALLDRVAGLDVLAVLHFLVGEHGAQGGAPVDGGLHLIGQAALEEHLKIHWVHL